MDLASQIRDAREAMLVAQINLDGYVNSTDSNPAQFQVLFEAVQAATEQYARLRKEQMEKYESIIDGTWM